MPPLIRQYRRLSISRISFGQPADGTGQRATIIEQKTGALTLAQGDNMAEEYAFYEGAFGQAIVLETRTDLVAHAHSESQLVFWLGGARARAQVGAEQVDYSEDVGLAANAFQSHDMTL